MTQMFANRVGPQTVSEIETTSERSATLVRMLFSFVLFVASVQKKTTEGNEENEGWKEDTQSGFISPLSQFSAVHIRVPSVSIRG
jgi:hypothetical protein